MRRCLLFGILLALGPLRAAEVPAELKPSFQIVNNLAEQIKGCEASFYEERRWGDKSNEIERGYLDRPSNVTWDGEEVPRSLRAPYRAYIEFTSLYFLWVPPETKAKYDRLPQLPNIHLGHFRFRYEFDVNSDGIKFTQAFVYYPMGGKSSEPFSRTDMCWDKWLRQSIPVRPSNAH